MHSQPSLVQVETNTSPRVIYDNYEYVDTGDTGEDVEDTSTTSETDTQDTEDTEDAEICKNDYHPIHLTGWSKTFTATYEGELCRCNRRSHW